MLRSNRLTLAGLLCIVLGCATEKSQLADNQLPIQPTPSSGVATAQFVQAPMEQQRSLRVVAYNVHLLPSVAVPFAGTRSAADYRARAIGEQLATYDLIGLSEAFNTKQSQALVEQLQARTPSGYHIAYGPGRSGTHLVGSGLAFCSRYPILETHTITYRNASRVLTNGLKSDGFAAKGALHAKVLLDPQSGATLDCFLTHLESQSPAARKLQVRELSEFVAEHYRADAPAIFLGDFNIAFESDADSEYADLLNRFAEAKVLNLVDGGQRLQAGPHGTSDAVAEDGGRRIDYIFSAGSAGASSVGLYPTRTEHVRFLDQEVAEGSLSDHLAVASEFLIIPQKVASLPQRHPTR
ncbi:sphingomyelin phosphodiesterase [Blastopirellula sp. JC732]|uniref:Sphingomyelin phosphodiesterase n=1 Tax=Blastopirellula sediminis TaxID=2894196 RepID=A0A9X1SGY6_9BACT|nr:sphingomyelin phosphodiesterase [Blastopirellula sediminis]MCC9604284.1 sphingomyelin phosphodiesterase [Blastopirellula sediminis]MCC9626804.1 sphingomyelin phosphodiesterase [Blastopirellula sediminis]